VAIIVVSWLLLLLLGFSIGLVIVEALAITGAGAAALAATVKRVASGADLAVEQLTSPFSKASSVFVDLSAMLLTDLQVKIMTTKSKKTSFVLTFQGNLEGQQQEQVFLLGPLLLLLQLSLLWTGWLLELFLAPMRQQMQQWGRLEEVAEWQSLQAELGGLYHESWT